MKVTAKNFLKDIEKVDWSKVPADFKTDAEQLKAVAPFYSEGGDLKAGLDAYVSALNAKLAKAKPKSVTKPKTLNVYLNKQYKPLRGIRVSNNRAKKGEGLVYVQFEYAEKHSNGTTGRTQYPIYRMNKELTGGQWLAGSYSKDASNNDFDKIEKEGIKVEKLLVKNVGKAAPKKKPAAKKATSAKPKSSTKKPSQSKAEAAKAKKEFEATKAKAVAGKFAGLSTKEILSIARSVNAKRSLSAQIVDGGVDHKKRLSPTPENLVRWMKEPGKFDMIGVDNYKANDPTADLKIKKDIFWNRLLKK